MKDMVEAAGHGKDMVGATEFEVSEGLACMCQVPSVEALGAHIAAD